MGATPSFCGCLVPPSRPPRRFLMQTLNATCRQQRAASMVRGRFHFEPPAASTNPLITPCTGWPPRSSCRLDGLDDASSAQADLCDCDGPLSRTGTSSRGGDCGFRNRPTIFHAACDVVSVWSLVCAPGARQGPPYGRDSSGLFCLRKRPHRRLWHGGAHFGPRPCRPLMGPVGFGRLGLACGRQCRIHLIENHRLPSTGKGPDISSDGPADLLRIKSGVLTSSTPSCRTL